MKANKKYEIKYLVISMKMMIDDDTLKVAVLLFVIYFFFIRPQHQQSADGPNIQFSIDSFLEQLGLDADSIMFRYLIMAVPFLYALRKDLGIEKLFDFFQISDKSSLVQI